VRFNRVVVLTARTHEHAWEGDSSRYKSLCVYTVCPGQYLTSMILLSYVHVLPSFCQTSVPMHAGERMGDLEREVTEIRA
jgi:hypothetical protein